MDECLIQVNDKSLLVSVLLSLWRKDDGLVSRFNDDIWFHRDVLVLLNLGDYVLEALLKSGVFSPRSLIR